jgi:hypothetical protein
VLKTRTTFKQLYRPTRKTRGKLNWGGTDINIDILCVLRLYKCASPFEIVCSVTMRLDLLFFKYFSNTILTDVDNVLYRLFSPCRYTSRFLS